MADVYLSVLLTLMFLKLKCILNKCTVYQIFALCVTPVPPVTEKNKHQSEVFCPLQLQIVWLWVIADRVLIWFWSYSSLISCILHCENDSLKIKLFAGIKSEGRNVNSIKDDSVFILLYITGPDRQTVSLFLFWSLCLSVCRPLWSPLRQTSSLGSFMSTCTVRRAPCTASLTTRCPTSMCPI